MAIDWLEEEDELGTLLRQLAPRFEAILRRYRIPPQDAPDRTQNVLLQFVYKRSQIRNPGAWICRALQLECLMYLRTERRRIVKAVEDAIIEVIADPLMPDAERELMKRRLGRWVRKLPWKCQNLLRLKFVEDLDAGEIAARTGYKRSSVDKVTRRCVSALKKKFDTAVSAISKRGKREEP